jgi:stage II sporulation protein Q
MREEENKRTSQESSFKRFMKKRWAFPAIYIASAAIILTAVFWYQTSSTNNVADEGKYDYNATDITGKNNNNPPAIEVNSTVENIKWPLMNPESATIQKEFYDVNGTSEQQEAALVTYGNSFQPNTGIDITTGNGATFDVVAALSGTVTKVQEDSLLGNVIVIEHENGVATQYQSITDFKVEEGDKVTQGQAIAKAGQSLLNEEAGVHVHFEIRKDGNPVNPISFFEKPVSSVMVEQPTPAADKKEAVEEQKNEEGNATEGSVDTNKNEEDAGTTPSDEKDKKEEGDNNADSQKTNS